MNTPLRDRDVAIIDRAHEIANVLHQYNPTEHERILMTAYLLGRLSEAQRTTALELAVSFTPHQLRATAEIWRLLRGSELEALDRRRP